MREAMIKPAIPLTPRAGAVLAVLIILGVLGNYANMPLFFGVDFIFGSIAVLVVVYFYGPALGVLAAVIASSYTYFLWGHPYAVIIFSLEALFVGFFLQSGRRSLILLDGLYWLVIGMPTAWLCNGMLMHMDGTSTLLIMLKQGINGIFNAMLASLAISFLPLRRILEPGPCRQTISLRETLFNLMVAVILAPALLIMLHNSRGEKREMQDATLEQMQRVGADITSQLGIWYQRNLEAVTQLAALAAKNPLEPSPALQHDTELIHKTLRNFQALCVANARGTTIAFSPAINKKGQSTIGLNFADRPYFKELQATRQPVLSEVIVGRAATFSPVVTLSVPILKGNRFSGYALGSMNLAHIQEILEPYGKLRHLAITLIDSQGRVIASTVPDRQPMMPWKRLEMTALRLIKDSVYHWLPDDKNLPMMARWKNSFYVQETTIAKMAWKLILETPVAPLQNRLYTIYIYNLGLMAAMAALALLIAALFSRWLVRPLTGLAQVTSNLPDKLLAHQDIPWPESSATEMHTLVANFQAMALTLEGNLQQLQERSAQLAEVNYGLEGEIVERVQVEAALRRSERLLRSIFDSTPDLLTVHDRDFNIIMSNWHLDGCLPEEARAAGLKCYQAYLRRDRHCDPCYMLKVFETGEPHRGELSNPADGRAREIVAYPIYDQSGQINLVALHVRDITPRRHMEEALKESEAKYRLLAENAQDVIWNIDRNLQFTYVSPAIQLLTGFTSEEALNKALDQVLVPASFRLAQETMAQLQEIELREKPQSPPSTTVEVEHFRKDGATVWAEVHATLLRGPQGEVAGFIGVTRDISERRKVREALETANAQLKILVQDSEERNRHMALLNEMSDVLQSCRTSEEAVSAIHHFVPQFFPTDTGALYLLGDTKNLLAQVAAWGHPPPSEAHFLTGDCWAIRSGRAYQVANPAVELLCKHISETDSLITGYLCVPLMAQGVSQGLLHIRFLSCATQGREAGELEAKERLALAIAENLALALVNVKLRETLQNQAIRDPLTGLYNRRYLEETMDRELHRARRLNTFLGVVMMDLDHFKDFNDTFGHAAGDALLSALGDLLKAKSKEEDIACRYGGEEFLLIMPGTTLAATRHRADHVRRAVKTLQVRWQDQLLKSTTISLGVAVFPDHGATGQEVIAAVAAALYRAKQAGRDRVELAMPLAAAAAAP
jgi:diguanylate cyclase (GGDEF)-like protein/PAS domain S-box-containing protein